MASATTTMIDIKVSEGLYIITASKCTLVMSREEFIRALKKGKWWKRRQAWQARHEEDPCPT